MGLFSFLTQEIAIDLGTANTIIIYNDKIVVDEPSIVAIDLENRKNGGNWRKSQANAGEDTCKP